MARVKKEKSKKEKNTQKRKRCKGFFKKGAELKALCDLDVAAFVRDPETKQVRMLIATDDSEWRSLYDNLVRVSAY